MAEKLVRKVSEKVKGIARRVKRALSEEGAFTIDPQQRADIERYRREGEEELRRHND